MKQSESSIELAAELIFWSLQTEEKQYHAYQLSRGMNAPSEKRAEIKLERLQALEKKLSHLATLGSSEWGLGAIFKIAYLYHRLAMEVMVVPPPTNLTAAQVDVYRDKVQTMVVKPLEDKALHFAKKCLADSASLQLFSPWIAQCYIVASEINPDNYPAIRTFYLPALEASVISDDDYKLPANLRSQLSLFPWDAPNRNTASAGPVTATLYQTELEDVEDLPQSCPPSLSRGENPCLQVSMHRKRAPTCYGHWP